uniref:Uncharacterized protein n=1 Tax=Dendroctonus ponderosae TaxID=77166 RepID=A0AAR5QEV0_DENPD
MISVFSLGGFSMNMSGDEKDYKQKLIASVKKEVKQVMEESVTRKFVHEESGSVTSLCGAVENCLSQGKPQLYKFPNLEPQQPLSCRAEEARFGPVQNLVHHSAVAQNRQALSGGRPHFPESPGTGKRQRESPIQQQQRQRHQAPTEEELLLPHVAFAQIPLDQVKSPFLLFLKNERS